MGVLGKLGAGENPGYCTRKSEGKDGSIVMKPPMRTGACFLHRRPPTPVVILHAAGIKAALGIIPWE